MASTHKFFEIIKPGTNIDFIGRERLWIGISIVATLVSILLLPINAYLIPGRGQMLNWSVEFKGGSEIEASFSKPVQPAEIRDALGAAGYHGVEAVRSYSSGGGHNDYMIRMGAVSPLSRDLATKAELALKQKKIGPASLRSFEWSEGGDKIYLRLDQMVETPALTEALKEVGINPLQVHTFGRVEDHNYEATLVSLDAEVKRSLEAKLGANTVTIKQVASVGAKAGEQLRNDGISAMLGAILLIVIYVAFRFDFRYGPGTIIALLHDAILTMGAFALTYKDIHFTDGAHYSSMQAEIEVKKNGAFVETMYPEKRFYKKQQQPTTEVALRSTLLEDLYLVLGSYDEASGLMTMIVFVNPLVNWLWIGGLVMVLGTVIVMSPTAAEQRAMAAALAVEGRGPEAALQ